MKKNIYRLVYYTTKSIPSSIRGKASYGFRTVERPSTDHVHREISRSAYELMRARDLDVAYGVYVSGTAKKKKYLIVFSVFGHMRFAGYNNRYFRAIESPRDSGIIRRDFVVGIFCTATQLLRAGTISSGTASK